MSSFNEREQSIEAKFAHDENLRFKATARRNKLLGQWAAGLLGLDATAAADLVTRIIRADFEEQGDEDVFRFLRAEFDKHKVEQLDHQIRHTMEELLAEAVNQVQAGS